MAEDRSPGSRLLGRLISPAVDAVDPDVVIDRVDIEALVERIDFDAIIERTDVDAVLEQIDINAALERIDIDALLRRIDVNALLDGADLNALLADLDLNALLASLDLNALVARVDLDKALAGLDLDAVISRVDLEATLAGVDIDGVVSRIDVAALVKRIDVAGVVHEIDVDDVVKRIDVPDVIARIDVDDVVKRIDVTDVVHRIDVTDVVKRIDIEDVVARIDIAKLVDRIDIDALVSRIDLDKQIESVDIPAIVQRAEIETMIGEATTGVVAATLDLARRQILGVDLVILRTVDRVLRRPMTVPAKIGGKADASGMWGGPLARTIAYVADAGIVALLFSFGTYLIGSLLNLFSGEAFSADRGGGPAWLGLYLAWWFVYLWVSVTISGRTPGKAIVGLRITTKDGDALISSTRAAVRALALPLSAVLGLGFLLGVIRKDRRTLHDLIAGSDVSIDWGDRQARLPSALEEWINRHQSDAENEDDEPPSDGAAVLDLHKAG